MRRRLSRRHLLHGLLGGSAVSLALPWLEVMSRTSPVAAASSSGFPTRFGLFFWGNGNRPDLWTPDGDGEEFSFSEELAPLEVLRDKLCIVSGMALPVENRFPHGSGKAILTGHPVEEVDGGEDLGAPTIDQVIAGEIGSETIYSSLQTAATDCSGMSYNGTNSRNPPETDPYSLYARLFGDTFTAPGSGGIVDPALGLRRSVLDAVMDDISALDAKVSAADRVRLEQHYTGIRELEQRLARLEEDPPDLEACLQPKSLTADFANIDGRPQIEARNRAMAEMLAMAFACDQTRVVGHYLSDPVGDTLFPDASAGHHDLTHNEGGDQPEVHAITTYCMQMFADFLSALDAIPEGEGTLLDHCAIMATSEVSLGQTHAIDEMPILLAGGGDGFFRTNYHHRSYTSDNAVRVLLTLLQSVGISATEFGAGDCWTDQVLSEILL
ncbi:MAG: DUF1552 domain-containing protein [Myxococcota bacterium]|nr:DUF1552 domain-containing protein [Myxococcota bacterium]